MDKFIGEKKIKQTTELKEQTFGGVSMIEVEYEDGTKGRFSSLMLAAITTDKAIDATALRDKRIFPVVEKVLGVLRDWGIKGGELPYMAAVLNQSLEFNERAALRLLWDTWLPGLKDPNDVDLITIDKVLRASKENAK